MKKKKKCSEEEEMTTYLKTWLKVTSHRKWAYILFDTKKRKIERMEIQK